MGRGSVRWIAIALVAAMVAALAVGLVSGRGEPADTPGRDRGTGADEAAIAATGSAALDGPHVVLELCTGVVCAPVDEATQQDLRQQVADDPRVAAAQLVSSEQAYQLFLEENGDRQDLVEEIDPETVPPEVHVDLHRVEDVEAVIDEFASHDAVGTARDARTPEVD